MPLVAGFPVPESFPAAVVKIQMEATLGNALVSPAHPEESPSEGLSRARWHAGVSVEGALIIEYGGSPTRCEQHQPRA